LRCIFSPSESIGVLEQESMSLSLSLFLRLEFEKNQEMDYSRFLTHFLKNVLWGNISSAGKSKLEMKTSKEEETERKGASSQQDKRFRMEMRSKRSPDFFVHLV
jgi:hypothetical protein